MPALVRLYEKLAAPSIVAAGDALRARFEALAPSSGEDEIVALAEDFAALVAPVLEELAATDWGLDLSDASDLIGAHTDSFLNDAQRRALAHVERLLGEAVETPPQPLASGDDITKE